MIRALATGASSSAPRQATTAPSSNPRDRESRARFAAESVGRAGKSRTLRAATGPSPDASGPPGPAQKQRRPDSLSAVGPSSHQNPAASYSPAGSPLKYHRRWKASLLCSEWKSVTPPLWPPKTWRRHTGARTGVPARGHGPENCRAGTWSSKSSPRAISTRYLLNTLLCLHIQPINQVVYQGPYPLLDGKEISISRRRFPLRCFQRLSPRRRLVSSAVDRQELIHQRSAHPGPLVLGATPLKSPTPTEDRDRTVSRRSEPSSRTAFNGRTAQPLRDLLSPRDAMTDVEVPTLPSM